LSLVYRGVQESLNRYVAIKVFVPTAADSEDSITRFMREAETASKLDHPNIVPVHELEIAEDGSLTWRKRP